MAALRCTAMGPAGSMCSQEPAGVSMVCRYQLAMLPAFPSRTQSASLGFPEARGSFLCTISQPQGTCAKCSPTPLVCWW